MAVAPATRGPSPAAAWGYAAAASLVLAVGIEEVPRVAVPLTLLVLVVMLLQWKGFS